MKIRHSQPATRLWNIIPSVHWGVPVGSTAETTDLPSQGKRVEPQTNSVSRLRAPLIRLRNGVGRRSPSRLLQRRLPAARPVALRLLRPAAIPRGHPYDADHQGQNGIFRPGESADRDSAGGSDERGSERRLGLLASHGGTGRGAPQTVQHPPR